MGNLYCIQGDSERNHRSQARIGQENQRIRTRSQKCIQDIEEVLRNFPGLNPKVDNFHFNDGRSQKLICLKGTIPISCR